MSYLERVRSYRTGPATEAAATTGRRIEIQDNRALPAGGLPIEFQQKVVAAAPGWRVMMKEIREEGEVEEAESEEGEFGRRD